MTRSPSGTSRLLRLRLWLKRHLLRPRWYIAGSVVLFVFIALFIFVFMPPLIVHGKDFSTPSSRVKAENDVRTTGVQALAGLALAIGAVFTAITLVYNREQQITERFTRAIDQLDETRALDIRVGGVYALERIMRDSKRDHGAIVDVLTAFIRTHSVDRETNAKGSHESATGKADATDHDTKPEADIQAALTVLGRRPSRPDLELDRLRLSDAVLRGALIRRTDFRCAGLRHADLRHAHMEGAILEGARLRGARLEYADLQGANLRWASLAEAHLEGASLTDAVLDHAKLLKAMVSLETSVENASFKDAHLAGLRGELHLTGKQLEQAHCRPDQPTCEHGRHELPPARHRCYEYETQGSSYYSRPGTTFPKVPSSPD
jgi:Pentapeptide repeats (8 copies)